MIKHISVFLGIMLGLTVLATTIEVHLQPCVETEEAVRGRLEKTVLAKGILGQDRELIESEQRSLRAPIQGLIEKCHVKVYEKVEKGDVLLTLTNKVNDSDILEKEINTKEIINEKNALTREKNAIQTNLSHLVIEYEELLREKENIPYNKDVVVAQKEMEYKAEQVNTNKMLYDIGAIAKKDYDTLLNELEEAKNNIQMIVEEREKDIEDALQETELNIAQLKGKQIGIDDELSLLDKKITLLQEEKDYYEILAPIDGYVYQLNAIEGREVEKEAILAVVIPENIPQIVEFTVPLGQGEFVRVGNEINFMVGDKMRQLEITSKTLKLDEDSYSIKAYDDKDSINSIFLGLGEYKEVVVEVVHDGAIYDTIVPLSAIAIEGSGEFIYIAEKKQNVWGTTYYAKKLPVRLIDDNDYYGAIEGSISKESLVIIKTSKPLQDGVEIRLE